MPKKEFIPWFKSFFTKKLVKTGEGFTVSDESLAQRRRDKNQKIANEGKNCAHCTTRQHVDFLFVGLAQVEGKVKYRLYHDRTRKMFDVDEALFELVFRFRRGNRVIRTIGRE